MENESLSCTGSPSGHSKKVIFFHSSKNRRIQVWTKEEDNRLLQIGREYEFKNWKEISRKMGNRTATQCSGRYKRIRPGIVKGGWTSYEDSLLVKLIEEHGKNWSLISTFITSKNSKQIRDRYINKLDRNVKNGRFSKDEDEKILAYYTKYGRKWTKIASYFPGRTGDMVKNRFYSCIRKKINFIKRTASQIEGELRLKRGDCEVNENEENLSLAECDDLAQKRQEKKPLHNGPSRMNTIASRSDLLPEINGLSQAKPEGFSIIQEKNYNGTNEKKRDLHAVQEVDICVQTCSENQQSFQHEKSFQPAFYDNPFNIMGSNILFQSQNILHNTGYNLVNNRKRYNEIYQSQLQILHDLLRRLMTESK